MASKRKTEYDLIIIGGGPAGLAAAVYGARQKLDFCVISKDIGGQTKINTYPIENYLGYYYITGTELEEKFEEHLKSFNVEVKKEEVKKVSRTRNGFDVITNGSTYHAKTLVIATGRINKILKVKGEKEFAGKGVSFCAHCDAPLFKDKTVVVVGGGRSGLDSASQLAGIASNVYVMESNDKIKHIGPVSNYVENHPRVKILTGTKILEIFGDKVVKGVRISENGKEKKVASDGVFVNVGYEPSTSFVRGLLKLNDRGEIVVDKNNQTNVSGIYAAGDCTDVTEKQVIVAAGEGAKAFIGASGYLTKLKAKRKK